MKEVPFSAFQKKVPFCKTMHEKYHIINGVQSDDIAYRGH